MLSIICHLFRSIISLIYVVIAFSWVSFLIAIFEFKHNGSFVEIYKKSVARFKRRGLKVMLFKLGGHYRSIGYEKFPILCPGFVTKKRVLFVDSQFPSPEKDAASYAALVEIRLFIALGYDVEFLALQNTSPLGAQKVNFEKLGIRFFYFDCLESQQHFVALNAAFYEIIYVTRYHVLAAISEMIRWWAPKAKIYLNLADLHYLREARLAGGDTTAFKNSLLIKQDELRQVNLADKVLTYSTYELNILKQEGVASEKLFLCPWVSEVTEPLSGFDGRVNISFLGNFEHVPNLEGLVWFISQVWPSLLMKLPGVKFVIYGSHTHLLPGDVYQAEGVEVFGWIEDVGEAYNSSRIFIAPLLSGAGVKGKVVGAFSHGVPCVLSEIAVEGIPIVHEQDAFVAITIDDWIKSIVNLYSNSDLWRAVSQSSIIFAATNYSFEKAKSEFKKILL